VDLERDLYYLLLRCKFEHRGFILFKDFLLHCKVMLIKAKFPSDAVLSYEHCLIALVCFFTKTNVSSWSLFSCVNKYMKLRFFHIS